LGSSSAMCLTNTHGTLKWPLASIVTYR